MGYLVPQTTPAVLSHRSRERILALRLTHDLARTLVVAEPLESRPSQGSLPRSLGELDRADQLGLDPDRSGAAIASSLRVFEPRVLAELERRFRALERR